MKLTTYSSLTKNCIELSQRDAEKNLNYDYCYPCHRGTLAVRTKNNLIKKFRLKQGSLAPNTFKSTMSKYYYQ